MNWTPVAEIRSGFLTLRGLIAASLCAAGGLVHAQGNIYTVNTTSDTVVAGACANGMLNCSLRGAIEAANSHPGPDGIEIVLPAGSVINLSGALPNLTDSVGIVGPGADLLTVRRGTGGSYRIFLVTATGFASFSGFKISNGSGAISNVNGATVTVKECTLSGNVTNSGGDGGGVFNNSTGRVNVIDCTFSSNSADKGGAVYNHSSGRVDVTDCTFASNGASKGGAIGGNGGTVNVTNCTFTGNGANLIGGAIYNVFGTVNVISSTFNANTAADSVVDGGGAICNGDSNGFFTGVLNVTNSTFVANFAFEGGAIHSVAGSITTVTNSTFSANRVGFGDSGGGIATDSTGPVNVKSCIIAGSNAGPNFTTPRSDVSGSFSSAGFNLIGKSDNSTGFTQATDQVGTIAAPLDPKFDPAGLQNNGGPTQTIALQPGSPALDKGTSSGLTGSLTTDQRGSDFPRTSNYTNISEPAGGDGTDIGACEGTRLMITSITRLANAHITVQGIGMPGRAHAVDTSPDLSPNSFSALPDPVVADGTGALQFDEPPPADPTKRFYRFRFP